MLSVYRCLKAEHMKYKHSILLYMHIIISVLCAVVFAGYYYHSIWSPMGKLGGYLEILAVSFPFLIGIIVSIAANIESQAGHFQNLLGAVPSRTASYLGQLIFLIIYAFGALFIALGLFAILYNNAPVYIYIKAGFLLLLTMLPIYIIHLFVGMNFGNGASIGLGIAGSLISALMLTGLGDGIWNIIPWGWGARAMDYIVFELYKPDIYVHIKSDFFNGMIISICCTAVLLAVSLIWFSHWEGRKNYE